MDVNITWIMENWTNEPSSIELEEAINKTNYSLIKIKDYSRDLVKHLKNQCVIFSGSINMAKIVKADIDPSCFPITFSNFSSYKCQHYYPKYVDYLFNDYMIWTTLKQFKQKFFFYYQLFGKEGLIFIRPDSGEKEFQAQLLDIQDVPRFCETNSHMDDELIVLSTPKNIVGEWRFVMSKTKIIAYSCYRFQGQVTKIPFAPPEVINLAEHLLKVGYFPDDVFCYDICLGGDNKPYLLELTSFSSAGLYACKKEPIVEEVSKIAFQQFKDRVL